MENSQPKKKPTLNLSIFTTLSESFSLPSPSNKSPRNFVQGGVVGLGIVAAMTDLTHQTKPDVTPAPPIPIPIVSSAKAATANFKGRLSDLAFEDEVDELSESYTCVISHLGTKLEKRVYFDDKLDGVVGCGGGGGGDCCVVSDGRVGVFSASPVNFGDAYMGIWTADFLSSCYLCKKQLHGLDIFMYRGEKAFCSAECRDKQIRSEDYKEKFASGALKPLKPLDYSVSPCSGPLMFFAGVVAA